MLIRSYQHGDLAEVIRLFREFMAEYTPAERQVEFDAYVERAIRDELGRIDAYYGEAFWVAEDDGTVVGMVGIERHSDFAAELRRMVVAAAYRRHGIARALLRQAEDFCRARGYTTIALSTSELQQPAMQLYESSGYRRVRTESAAQTTHKMVGGLTRHYYEKAL